MRKYLLAAVLFASTLSVQTTVVAQPAPEEGSRAYCEARWARMVQFGTTGHDSEAAFVDKCMSCEAKWNEMTGSGQTGTDTARDRSAYLRQCSKAAYWGYNYNKVPEFALLLVGAAGVGVGYALAQGEDHDNDLPVSP